MLDDYDEFMVNYDEAVEDIDSIIEETEQELAREPRRWNGK